MAESSSFSSIKLPDIRELHRLVAARSIPIEAGGPHASDLNDAGAFHALLRMLPAAVYLTDSEGKITFYNEAATRLWGCQPTQDPDKWCGFLRLHRPDGTPLPDDQCPMAIALKDGQAIDAVEVIAKRQDGTLLPILVYPTPIFGRSGRIIGAMNMLVDITKRKAAEAATCRLAAIVESSDDAIVSKDLKGIITSWNPGAQKLFGYLEQEVLGKSVTILIPADRQDEEPEILARVGRGERVEHYETVRQRKDGSLVDISLSVSPIIDGHGQVIGASKIARDIGERKSAERYKDLLLREMSHRAKNAFAMVSSIVNNSFPSSTRDERATCLSRITALAKANEILVAQNWRGARLTDIVERVMKPHSSGKPRIHLSGPDVSVDSGRAVSISLILNELATNAVKYGALSLSAGRVDVEWEASESDLVQLRWREHGGPEVLKPQKRGFGSRLIERGLTAEFDSVDLEFLPEGVLCILQFATTSRVD